MRSILITLSLVVMALFTSACHTMQGAGQDIKEGGQKLQNSATKHSCGCNCNK